MPLFCVVRGDIQRGNELIYHHHQKWGSIALPKIFVGKMLIIDINS